MARAGGCCSFGYQTVFGSHTCCLKRDCGTFGQHRFQKNPSSEPAPTNWAKYARRISLLRSSRPGRFRTATRFFWHLPFSGGSQVTASSDGRGLSAQAHASLARVAFVNTPAARRALRVITLSLTTEELRRVESSVLNVV